MPLPCPPYWATRVSLPPPHLSILLMIIRLRGTSLPYFLLLLISAASSQLDSECHLSVGDYKYDLSALSGDHTTSRTRSSPPTTITDTLRFNVCKELSPLEGVPPGDQVRIRNNLRVLFSDEFVQCSSGTWACFSKTNVKQGEPDRVFAVIPIAQDPDLRAEYAVLKCAFITAVALFRTRIDWHLHVSPTRCQNDAAWSLIPLIDHIRAHATGFRPQFVMCDGSIRARVQVV